MAKKKKKELELGPNYFTYPRLYESMVDRFADGDVFVEVGCFYGRSVIHLAEAIKKSGKDIKIICVDLWGEVMDEKPFDGEPVYQHFLENTKSYEDIITVIRGCSWEVAEQFEDGSFAFVFIDADHTYDSVVKDLQAWTKKVRSGGVVAGHDFFHQPIKKALAHVYGKHHDLDAGESCWKKDVL